MARTATDDPPIMKTRTTGYIIAIAFLAFGTVASADCDPNSPDADKPLLKFDIILGTSPVTKFPCPPKNSRNICTFPDMIMPHMRFKKDDASLQYTDLGNGGLTFVCRDDGTGLDFTPTLRQLLGASEQLVGSFGGRKSSDFYRVQNCVYGSWSSPGMVPSPKPAQSTKSSAKVADADVGSFNLQNNDRRLITGALQKSAGDSAVAAKKLGISERALLRKMKEYGIK